MKLSIIFLIHCCNSALRDAKHFSQCGAAEDLNVTNKYKQRGDNIGLDHHSHKQNILWQALCSHCLLRMNINVNLKRSNVLCVVKTDFTDSCGSVFEGRNRWESQSSRWVAVNIYWLIAFKAEENWKFRFHFRMIISLMIAHCQQRYLKLKFLWMNHVEQCVLF